MTTIDSSHDHRTVPPPSEETVYQVLGRIGHALELAVERSSVLPDRTSQGDLDGDSLSQFRSSAQHAGIFIKEVEFEGVDDVIGFLEEGYPVVVAHTEGTFSVFDALVGRRIEGTFVGREIFPVSLSRRETADVVFPDTSTRIFVAKRELDCDSISNASGAEDHHDEHHAHISPIRRFLGLLDMERRDIWTVSLFAFVSGVLTLATPLAVESLVNVVSWGTYVQPLIVLGLVLLTCLGIAGILKLLQTVVVEMIQRRQFVRIVSDLAHRFPRANQASLAGEYPRELANRVFDIMTIQKATAVLLLDGMSIVLTTALGMVLLAFYHPFLLGFDIVLLISMISITWLLGRGGIRTAIDESITKYRVAHWLQDVIASPTVFKCGGEELAIARANQLTTEYIHARQKQFRVVIRQVAFAISLQVIASTAVLGLGGWLVIEGQLTLGQLVASELVVTVVVGAFAKAGKSLEKFYDLMAGVDKVGHLIDIPTDHRHELAGTDDSPVGLRWSDLVYQRASSTTQVSAATIEPGSTVAIVGDDVDGRSDLVKTLAGLCQPSQGLAQVGAADSLHVAGGIGHRLIGYAGEHEVFRGTLRENVDLGRVGIGSSGVRDALGKVGLADAVLRLPKGLQTLLQTDGFPLSPSQVSQLVIARAIVAGPKVLVIDGLLDDLAEDIRMSIWDEISGIDAPWTLVVVTNCDDIIRRCDSRIAVRRGNG